MMDKDDVYEYWSQIQHDVANECWDEFLKKRKIDKYGYLSNSQQTWSVMDSLKFIPLVRKAHAGTLSNKDIELIDEYAELVFFNACKLEFNTIMVGHTSSIPYYELLQHDLVPENMSKWRAERCANAYCEWVPAHAFSDYGLEPIMKLLIPLMLQKNPALRMQIMTEVIGICHMRGDLALLFVGEGYSTYVQAKEYYEESESISN